VKTFRIDIIDFDGLPAVLVFQGKHKYHAIARAIFQVRRWYRRDFKNIQVLSIEEIEFVNPDDTA
jgi:hypothetical protein